MDIPKVFGISQVCTISWRIFSKTHTKCVEVSFSFPGTRKTENVLSLSYAESNNQWRVLDIFCVTHVRCTKNQ